LEKIDINAPEVTIAAEKIKITNADVILQKSNILVLTSYKTVFLTFQILYLIVF
jgi:hypothetical protein